MSMTLTNRDWMEQATCRDADAPFFPSNRRELAKALSFCNKCPVSADCLQYALDNGIEYGVWGGTTESERLRIRQSERLRGIHPTA